MLHTVHTSCNFYEFILESLNRACVDFELKRSDCVMVK